MKPIDLVIFTDLDGTLLDQTHYGYQASLPAIRRVQSRNIPLILCSSKTRHEMEPLWRELDLKDPFIVENGGAIYFLPDTFPFSIEHAELRDELKRLPLGQPIDRLRHVLLEEARRVEAKVQFFTGMTPARVAELTGLSPHQVLAASQREFDEPFVVESNQENLLALLSSRGYTISRGDRFHHVSHGSDKGKATRVVLDLLRRMNPALRSVGLGNSANDLPLLRVVDQPILVRNPDLSWDEIVAQQLPTVRKTARIGPEGWREAIEEILAA